MFLVLKSDWGTPKIDITSSLLSDAPEKDKKKWLKETSPKSQKNSKFISVVSQCDGKNENWKQVCTLFAFN